MITQELIDYVKGQLSAGVQKDKIITDLLNQGGWGVEQINEAFRTAESMSPHSSVVPTTTNTSSSPHIFLDKAPSSIKFFEWLMYGSFLVSAIVWLVQFGFSGYLASMFVAIAVPIIAILIKFVCVYRVVYHRAEWARIVLVVLFALNALSIFGLIFYAFSNPIVLVTTLPVIMEIAAIYFVFKTPSNEWLSTQTHTQNQGEYGTENKKWTKVIPRLNTGFIGISVLLVFVLDLVMLLNSPELASFFFAMLAVFAIFVIFFLYENRKLKQKFANSYSRLDTWFVSLVVLRDLVFVLNFIPFIQILGGVALTFGGIPYLIVYFVMLRVRNKSITTV